MTVGGGVTISFGLTSSTTPAGPSLGVGSAVHILSQKVSRALELRTDTPTMTSALEALASLSSSSSAHYDNTSCNPQQARTGIVDSKLVRSIMEKDALNQALLYQSQLESLLRSVADMKSSIASASAIVASVQSAIEMDVCHVSGAGKSSYKQALDHGREMDAASVAVDPQMAPTTANEDSSAVPESAENDGALSPTTTDISAINKQASVNSTVDATSTTTAYSIASKKNFKCRSKKMSCYCTTISGSSRPIYMPHHQSKIRRIHKNSVHLFLTLIHPEVSNF